MIDDALPWLTFYWDGRDPPTVLRACLCNDADRRLPPLAGEIALARISRALGAPIVWPRDHELYEPGTYLGHPTAFGYVAAEVPEHASDLRRIRMLDGVIRESASCLAIPDEDRPRVGWRVQVASERDRNCMRSGVDRLVNTIALRVLTTLEARVRATS